MAVGEKVDCRKTPDACAAFSLETTDQFEPVCDYGCKLWASGLCGRSYDHNTCQAKCLDQNWGWDYIGCLETYATGICPPCTFMLSS